MVTFLTTAAMVLVVVSALADSWYAAVAAFLCALGAYVLLLRARRA